MTNNTVTKLDDLELMDKYDITYEQLDNVKQRLSIGKFTDEYTEVQYNKLIEALESFHSEIQIGDYLILKNWRSNKKDNVYKVKRFDTVMNIKMYMSSNATTEAAKHEQTVGVAETHILYVGAVMSTSSLAKCLELKEDDIKDAVRTAGFSNRVFKDLTLRDYDLVLDIVNMLETKKFLKDPKDEKYISVRDMALDLHISESTIKQYIVSEKIISKFYTKVPYSSYEAFKERNVFSKNRQMCVSCEREYPGTYINFDTKTCRSCTKGKKKPVTKSVSVVDDEMAETLIDDLKGIFEESDNVDTSYDDAVNMAVLMYPCQTETITEEMQDKINTVSESVLTEHYAVLADSAAKTLFGTRYSETVDDSQQTIDLDFNPKDLAELDTTLRSFIPTDTPVGKIIDTASKIDNGATSVELTDAQIGRLIGIPNYTDEDVKLPSGLSYDQVEEHITVPKHDNLCGEIDIPPLGDGTVWIPDTTNSLTSRHGHIGIDSDVYTSDRVNEETGLYYVMYEDAISEERTTLLIGNVTLAEATEHCNLLYDINAHGNSIKNVTLLKAISKFELVTSIKKTDL